jgi:hypothetical protein
VQQALFRNPNLGVARTLLENIHRSIQARQNAAQTTIATTKP